MQSTGYVLFFLGVLVPVRSNRGQDDGETSPISGGHKSPTNNAGLHSIGHLKGIFVMDLPTFDLPSLGRSSPNRAEKPKTMKNGTSQEVGACRPR